MDEEVEEYVEEILESSEQKISTSGWNSVVIDTKDDLEKVLEVIRRVYEKKPCDLIQFELVWCED